MKSSFYWWQPDPTFLSLDAVRTLFEPFDRAAQGRGILLTDFEAISVDKYASFDLKSLAPSVRAVERFQLGSEPGEQVDEGSNGFW